MTMTPRFRTASLFGALAACLWAATAWAGDATVQEDAARAMQRGERLIQEGHYKEASAEFERASDLAGGACPDCLLGVARAYSGARQYNAALQVTRMALALYSSPEDQARAYEQLGTLLALKGEMNAARDAYGKAVQLDGRMAGQVRSSFAEALLKRASYDTAKGAQGAAAAVAQEVAATAGGPQK
jgi:tetratricopeptide (TPR) repeat protein